MNDKRFGGGGVSPTSLQATSAYPDRNARWRILRKGHRLSPPLFLGGGRQEFPERTCPPFPLPQERMDTTTTSPVPEIQVVLDLAAQLVAKFSLLSETFAKSVETRISVVKQERQRSEWGPILPAFLATVVKRITCGR